MNVLSSCRNPARFFTVLVVLFFYQSSFAQTKVSGRITEKRSNSGLSGVSVIEKGTKNGVSTSENGEFSIVVQTADPVLEISFVGYQAQQVRVSKRTRLDLSLEEQTNGLNDVVVIGYQSVQRRKSTAAISTVKGKDFENVPYPTFDQMLQGRVPGLNVLNISGEPGGNNIVNIRGNSAVDGISSISAPLYVIDGIVFDVADVRNTYGNSNPLLAINPNDIESVDVLKDASAAAIYGARAGNGVIIIRTKRPVKGRAQLRVSGYVGVSTKPEMKPVIVGAEERRIKMDLLRSGLPYDQQGGLSQFLTDSLNPSFNNNTDWQGLFLTNAIIKNVDASIAAAEERFEYRFSINQFKEDGIIRGYSINRLSPRLYMMVKPFKAIQIQNDLYVSVIKSTHGPGNGSIYPFGIQNFPSSFWHLRDEDKANFEGRNDKVRDDDRNTSLNGNTRLIATLAPKLLFTSSLSYNFGFARRDYLRHKSINNPSTRSDAIHSSNNSRRVEIENFLTYTKDIKDHSITALIGQGAESQNTATTSANANGIPFDAIQMIQGVPAGPNLNVSTFYEDRTRLSLFARVSYDYRGKYGVDASYRRDASSRYASSSRWGAFPALSARWNVSEERFFEPFKNIVSFLKFRGSFGLTGRDPGSYYAQYRQLTTNQNYQGATNVLTYNGTTAVTPDYNAAAPATNITWERFPQGNIGIDAAFFKDRISLTLDYYNRQSRELVFDVPVPTTTGYTLAKNNYVDVTNRGVELQLTTNNLSPASIFRWSTTLNVAFNDNYVTKLPAGGRDFIYGPSWQQQLLTIGRPLYSYLAWQVPQIYPTIDDVPVDPLTGQRVRWQGGNFFGAGDGAKMDVNGDYNIQDIDKVYVGNPQTRIYGGLINTFQYKGFMVSMLINFIQGRKLWNGYLSDKLAGASISPAGEWGLRAGPAADFNGLGFWTANGDQAGLPSLFGNNVDKWHIGQDLFVEDASFVRLKNINFSYAIPSRIVNKLKLKSIRVYSIVDNLFILKRADVPDPEIITVSGYTSANDYPLPKKFTLGIDFNF